MTDEETFARVFGRTDWAVMVRLMYPSLPGKTGDSANLVDNVARPWPFGRPPCLGGTLMECVIHRQDSYPDNAGHWRSSVALAVLLGKVSA